MATQTAPLTHCPTCGVKLERPELSLCAYCASPLRVGPIEVPNDETQKRLAKVKAHADFASALSWLPIDPVFEKKAARSWSIGWLLVAGGIAVALLCWAFHSTATWASPEAAASFRSKSLAAVGVMLLLGIGLVGFAASIRGRHRKTPMLKRAAYVIDRSSKTAEHGGIGSTTYLFKIRFEDGSEGEFSHVGRGSMYEPPANGAAGVAYTRGARMIEFRRI
ncbi:MAG TPA: hypothetical protein VK843_19245 [Planctomycetota bacterium]|nr:hypothetical protein [Planctomycetota bacterium]